MTLAASPRSSAATQLPADATVNARMTHDADTPIVDARRAERRQVHVRVPLREAGCSRIEVDLIDLSATGFRFESFYAVATGARVFLHIPSFSPFEAYVAWRDPPFYGCRFDRPLHEAVFQTIAARFPGD